MCLGNYYIEKKPISNKCYIFAFETYIFYEKDFFWLSFRIVKSFAWYLKFIFFLYWHVIDVVLGFVNRIFICFQHSNIITCTSIFQISCCYYLGFLPLMKIEGNTTIQQNPQYRIKLGLTIPSSFLFSASHAVVVTGNGR